MSFPKQERFPLPDQVMSLRSKALGHPARLNILRQLLDGRARCVMELSLAIPLSQPSISGHLRILRKVGFIAVVERGLYNYYTLNRVALEEYRRVVQAYLESII